jgi:hypothetical protein
MVACLQRAASLEVTVEVRPIELPSPASDAVLATLRCAEAPFSCDCSGRTVTSVPEPAKLLPPLLVTLQPPRWAQCY